MASVSKCTSKLSKKEIRPRTPPEEKRMKAVSEELVQSSAMKGEDIQALAIRLEDLEKVRVPQPPKEAQKTPAVTRVLVRRPRPPQTERKTVRVTVARPVPQESTVQPLDYTGLGGPRFDAQGMMLPHSILGSLEDFKREMEARGKMELGKRVPDSPVPRPLVAKVNKCSPLKLQSVPDQQTKSLLHWEHHMRERRRQQEILSQLLQKPAQGLLMNQSSQFRETQEQRGVISRGLPALHSGQGHHVGSEFWNLPQHIGDELSGLTATLTRTERGHPEAITFIGQPRQIREETGNVLSDTTRSAYHTWDRSLYLQHRWQEPKAVLKDLDFRRPEIDGLEVIGSSQTFTSATTEHFPLQEEVLKEQEEEKRDEVEERNSNAEENDPLAQYDDVVLDAVLIPALLFNGQSAHWMGDSTSNQDEVGITARLSFEAVAGERASCHLELQNKGSTAIYYCWQRQPIPHSFPEIRRFVYEQRFYFNSSTGVILPGDTHWILFTFKSTVPGIFHEAWCLNTHPVLLGGARLLVSLRGVSLYQDRTAELREALQSDLQKKEAVSVCRMVVDELLQGVHTPERPCSPADLYLTEEDRFNGLNPLLHYLYETVEELKQLWEQTTRWSENKLGNSALGSQPWDLSMSTLRQALLAMPEGDREGPVYRQKEEALARFNTLYLELQKRHERPPRLSPHCIGLQLWRELLDGLVNAAMWHRQLLGLPQSDVWTDGQLGEARLTMKNEEGLEKKGRLLPKEEKKGVSTKEKDENRGQMKQPGKDKLTEEHLPLSKKHLQEEKQHGIPIKGSSSMTNGPERESLQQVENIHLQEMYRRRLHQQVYVLMEMLVDSLCDLLDEARSCQSELGK